jgi:hypothetical protein
MSDEAKLPAQNEIKARLVAEAEATITRDMAEFERIALKYNIGVNTFLAIIGKVPASSEPSILLAPELPPVALENALTPAFDGTFRGLIKSYRTHPRSPIHLLKYSVRLNYERSFNRIESDIGEERVGACSAEMINKFYEVWKDGDKLAMAHELIGKLRLLSSFGSTVLNDDDCIRLGLILSNMRFPISRGGKLQRLTRENARAIRIAAREHFGWDSIALAAALQFEIPKLRIMDIIGEWVPLTDPAESDIKKGSEKWIRGLRWSDLNDSFILRRTLPSGRVGQSKEFEFSLRRSQMSMEEINRVPIERRKGPMIICEFSNIPWTAPEFRRKWKIVAEKAGVPTSRFQPTHSEEELEFDDEATSET